MEAFRDLDAGTTYLAAEATRCAEIIGQDEQPLTTEIV